MVRPRTTRVIVDSSSDSENEGVERSPHNSRSSQEFQERPQSGSIVREKRRPTRNSTYSGRPRSDKITAHARNSAAPCIDKASSIQKKRDKKNADLFVPFFRRTESERSKTAGNRSSAEKENPIAKSKKGRKRPAEHDLGTDQPVSSGQLPTDNIRQSAQKHKSLPNRMNSASDSVREYSVDEPAEPIENGRDVKSDDLPQSSNVPGGNKSGEVPPIPEAGQNQPAPSHLVVVKQELHEFDLEVQVTTADLPIPNAAVETSPCEHSSGSGNVQDIDLDTNGDLPRTPIAHAVPKTPVGNIQRDSREESIAGNVEQEGGPNPNGVNTEESITGNVKQEEGRNPNFVKEVQAIQPNSSVAHTRAVSQEPVMPKRETDETEMEAPVSRTGSLAAAPAEKSHGQPGPTNESDDEIIVLDSDGKTPLAKTPIPEIVLRTPVVNTPRGSRGDSTSGLLSTEDRRSEEKKRERISQAQEWLKQDQAGINAARAMFDKNFSRHYEAIYTLNNCHSLVDIERAGMLSGQAREARDQLLKLYQEWNTKMEEQHAALAAELPSTSAIKRE